MALKIINDEGKAMSIAGINSFQNNHMYTYVPLYNTTSPLRFNSSGVYTATKPLHVYGVLEPTTLEKTLKIGNIVIAKTLANGSPVSVVATLSSGDILSVSRDASATGLYVCDVEYRDETIVRTVPDVQISPIVPVEEGDISPKLVYTLESNRAYMINVADAIDIEMVLPNVVDETKINQIKVFINNGNIVPSINYGTRYSYNEEVVLGNYSAIQYEHNGVHWTYSVIISGIR